jgi:L-asparaginase II
VSGPTRFDYEIARAFGGRVVCKGGAEALLAIGFSDPPLGIAIKILDGGDRALPPVGLAVLGELGLLDGATRTALAHRAHPAITNYRGIETGAIAVPGQLLTAAPGRA